MVTKKNNQKLIPKGKKGTHRTYLQGTRTFYRRRVPRLNNSQGPFFNKRGWIKIIEAFISILFLIGVIAIVIQNDNFYSQENPILEKKQIEILNGIQLNKTLRVEVLATTDYTINSTNPLFSTKLKNYLDSNKINNAECFLKVCLINSSCSTDVVKNEMYVKSVLVTSTLSEYNPKKVQIFCYKI